MQDSELWTHSSSHNSTHVLHTCTRHTCADHSGALYFSAYHTCILIDPCARTGTDHTCADRSQHIGFGRVHQL
jgi:hypothetical protein